MNLNPFVRHPHNCITALLKGVPLPFQSKLGTCDKCQQPAAYLATNGNQYQQLCDAHAQEFRAIHHLTGPVAVIAPAPQPTRRSRSKKGAK